MNCNPMLIGLYSSTMQSGKTTVAEILRDEYGFQIVRFSNPLKAMTSELLKAIGIEEKDERDRYIYGDLKETPIPALAGKTSRYIQQRIGTEFGRDLIAKSVWADIAIAYAEKLGAKGLSVVIDDMRFPQEFEAVQEAGGKTVQVFRPGAPSLASSEHPSEGQLDGFPFDAQLANDSSIQNLEIKTLSALEDLAA